MTKKKKQQDTWDDDPNEDLAILEGKAGDTSTAQPPAKKGKKEKKSASSGNAQKEGAMPQNGISHEGARALLIIFCDLL